MTSMSTHAIIQQIEQLIAQNQEVPRDLFEELRTSAGNTSFLLGFDAAQFKVLVSRIFMKLTNLQDQLDTIRAISNILLVNEDLRNSSNDEIVSVVNDAIPSLTDLLDQVSERRINSESQYKDFLPIFRLFFLLSHNSRIIANLRTPIIKTSNKLLNFVSLSSAESVNLNIIIIEILKIIYSFVHQVEDTTGIDSPFVLSFNKFQLIYAKTIPNTQYDEILQHFGNVLMAIDPQVSNSYMMNTLKFCVNEINFLNRITEAPTSIANLNILTNSLLALQVAIDISDDSEVRKYIKENLDLSRLESFPLPDPNYPIVLKKLKSELSSTTSDTDATAAAESPLYGFDRTLRETVSSSQNPKYVASADGDESVPRFQDLTHEEQEAELDKMNDLFDKIEKNGIFKLQMK